MWKSIFLIVASIKYVNAASQFKPRKKYITNCFNQDLIYSSPNPNPTKQPKPKLPISPHVGSAVPEMAPLHTVWPCLAHWEEFMIKLLARLTESAVMGGGMLRPTEKATRSVPEPSRGLWTWLLLAVHEGQHIWSPAEGPGCWSAMPRCTSPLRKCRNRNQSQMGCWGVCFPRNAT